MIWTMIAVNEMMYDLILVSVHHQTCLEYNASDELYLRLPLKPFSAICIFPSPFPELIHVFPPSIQSPTSSDLTMNYAPAAISYVSIFCIRSAVMKQVAAEVFYAICMALNMNEPRVRISCAFHPTSPVAPYDEPLSSARRHRNGEIRIVPSPEESVFRIAMFLWRRSLNAL